MARSVLIDHIGFTNMKRGTESIIVKYNETKSDKTGKRCTNKNVYANPTDPSICFSQHWGSDAPMSPSL